MSGIRLISNLVLMLLTGCSFMMVRGPRQQSVSETPRCSTGKGAVVVDGVLAGVYAVAAFAVRDEGGDAAAIPLAMGGLHVTSMLTGNGRVERCRAAVSAHEAWLTQARAHLAADAEARPAAKAVTGPAARPPPATAQAAARPRQQPAATAVPAPVRPDTISNPPAATAREEPEAPSDDPWADFWVRPQ